MLLFGIHRKRVPGARDNVTRPARLFHRDLNQPLRLALVDHPVSLYSARL
jgi:hypothetical protein